MLPSPSLHRNVNGEITASPPSLRENIYDSPDKGDTTMVPYYYG
jgi:hypothetical protein